MAKRQCKIEKGQLYCKFKGRWRKVSNSKIRMSSNSRPFNVKKSFHKVRTNVC